MTGAFADALEPTTWLTKPVKPAEFKDPLKAFNDACNYMSPTYWIALVFEKALGFNPINESAKWVAGDWEGYGRCADAWYKAGAATHAIGTNLERGNGELDTGWHGNAADAAHVYFGTTAKAISDQRTTFRALHDQYMIAAEGCWRCAQALGQVLQALWDAVLIAAVEIAAGTILAETVVGAVVGYGLAALEIAEIIKLWNAATKIAVDAQNIANGAVGTFQATIGQSGDVRYVPPPGGSYDHPAVS